jgi:hypothetical protein
MKDASLGQKVAQKMGNPRGAHIFVNEATHMLFPYSIIPVHIFHYDQIGQKAKLQSSNCMLLLSR